MNLEGQYIEYNGQMCIVVCFDGVEYWLVPEERVEKASQIFKEEMFIKVDKDEMQNLIDEMEL